MASIGKGEGCQAENLILYASLNSYFVKIVVI
jgi:hypothetical protein